MSPFHHRQAIAISGDGVGEQASPSSLAASGSRFYLISIIIRYSSLTTHSFIGFMRSDARARGARFDEPIGRALC